MKKKREREERARRRRRRMIADLVQGELEEDALRDVLPSTGLPSDIRWLNRHLPRVQGELGDDNSAVGLGHVGEVLGQERERFELLKGVGALEEGLELAVPIEYSLK